MATKNSGIATIVVAEIEQVIYKQFDQAAFKNIRSQSSATVPNSGEKHKAPRYNEIPMSNRLKLRPQM